MRQERLGRRRGVPPAVAQRGVHPPSVAHRTFMFTHPFSLVGLRPYFIRERERLRVMCLRDKRRRCQGVTTLRQREGASEREGGEGRGEPLLSLSRPPKVRTAGRPGTEQTDVLQFSPHDNRALSWFGGAYCAAGWQLLPCNRQRQQVEPLMFVGFCYVRLPPACCLLHTYHDQHL